MKENNTSGGLGFSSVLQIVFIVLKLLGKISWSWWWVLSPTWVSILLLIITTLIIGYVNGIFWRGKI